jgi:uncharacterized damage-inducible protein DinB
MNMRSLIRAVLGLWFAIGAGAHQAAAQDAAGAQPSAPTDKTQPSYDMKAQAVYDLQQLQKKFVSLAGAIPAEKYTWRPVEGVRSISELFLHISAANYNIPTLIGGTPNPSSAQKDFDKSTTDKAKIVEQLNRSFGNAISAVQGMSNADFAKPEKRLGPDANDGDVVYKLVTHAHEHLGQAIAYARMNGVVPPWTAAALKKTAGQAQE